MIENKLLELLIPFIPLAIELAKDINQYKKTGTVDHKLGVATRLVFTCLFLMFFGFGVVGLQIAYHILIFDHVMGYVITSNPFYLGNTSKTDKLIRKLPNTIILGIRIIIAAFASSLYFFQDQWINLF